MAVDRFFAGAQGYLRDVQYADPTKLTARASLHVKYSTAEISWHLWVARQVAWPAGGDVLEVGCGPGWFWAEASTELPQGLKLTLTDLSPGMVQAAADRVRALDRFRLVDARAADAQQLPYASESFDVVVANRSLSRCHSTAGSFAVAADDVDDDLAENFRADVVILTAGVPTAAMTPYGTSPTISTKSCATWSSPTTRH